MKVNVVGNGFDLAHNLRTFYHLYRGHIKMHNLDLRLVRIQRYVDEMVFYGFFLSAKWPSIRLEDCDVPFSTADQIKTLLSCRR